MNEALPEQCTWRMLPLSFPLCSRTVLSQRQLGSPGRSAITMCSTASHTTSHAGETGMSRETKRFLVFPLMPPGSFVSKLRVTWWTAGEVAANHGQLQLPLACSLVSLSPRLDEELGRPVDCLCAASTGALDPQWRNPYWKKQTA